MRKVESDTFIIHVRSCLLYVCAQHLAQCCLQEVTSGVVAANGFACFIVDICDDRISDLQHTTYHCT